MDTNDTNLMSAVEETKLKAIQQMIAEWGRR